MKKILLSCMALIGVVGIVSLTASPTLHAINPADEIKKGINASGNPSGGRSLSENIKTITNVLLFILGVLAVIVIIIGGIRFTVSGGDSNSVTGAKNMILYAVVGLVVALIAYAIVNFVVDRF